MEIIKKHNGIKTIKAVLFDFDGTISTLRHGWSAVMKELMLDMISGPEKPDPELVKEVDDYIALSTGIQTIHQMKWLAEAVKRHGRNPGASSDPWWYKAQYRERLMKTVDARKQALASGRSRPEEFLIRGSCGLLSELRKRGLELFVASGTDYEDVLREAELLGVSKYFNEILGAPEGKVECPKTVLINKILNRGDISPDEMAVFGDGPVEVELAGKAGALAVGVASDEDKLWGVNPVKRKRLIAAGAHAIIGDYGNIEEILAFLRLN